jgi:hypothetical protein
MSNPVHPDDPSLITPESLADSKLLLSEAGELMYVGLVDGKKQLVPLPFPPDRGQRRYIIMSRDGLPAWVATDELTEG